jgi:hypothetical protein
MNTNELEATHKRLVNLGELRTTSSSSKTTGSFNTKPVRFTLDGDNGENSANWQSNHHDGDYSTSYGSQHSAYMSEQEQMDDENDLTLEHMSYQDSAASPATNDYFFMPNYSNFYETNKSQQNNPASKKFNPASALPPNNFSLINSYCHSMPQLYPHVNANQALLTYFNLPPPMPLPLQQQHQQQHQPHQQKPYHHVNTYGSNLSFMAAPHSSNLVQFQNVHPNKPVVSPNKESLLFCLFNMCQKSAHFKWLN